MACSPLSPCFYPPTPHVFTSPLFPSPAILLPHPPSHLTLQSSPPLRLSLPSHLVTSRTPSQPYWFTWPPCFCCHIQGIDYLTPGQPYWFTRCCGVISTSTLSPLLPCYPPPSLPHSSPCSSPRSISCCGNTAPFKLPFSCYTLPPIPTPHAFVDLLPRLVALKADDPTFLTDYDHLVFHCILLFVPLLRLTSSLLLAHFLASPLSNFVSLTSPCRWLRPTGPCRICAAALDAMGIQTDLRG